MSWDAELYVPLENGTRAEVGWWNYTHNTNRMIAACLSSEVEDHFLVGPCWWHELNGMSGASGFWFLTEVITRLEAEPERFRAMNLENRWGSYDDLLKVLTEMRDRSGEFPETGRWECSG